MKYIVKLILLLILVINPIDHYAVSYTFRNIAVSEGLSDLVVNSIYKDKQGYVWLGTNTSIVRYDGITLKTYADSGSDTKKKRVYCIAECNDGKIIFGNGSGLWRIDNSSESAVRLNENVVNSAVYSLAVSEDGTIYAGTEKGLFISEGTNEKLIVPDENIFSPANIIRGIIPGGNNSPVWIATDNGLYSVDSKGDHTYHGTYSPSEHSNIKEKSAVSFYNITRVGNHIYLGTMGSGLIKYDIRAKRFSKYCDVGCNIISSLSGNGTDLIYVGTDGNGVHFISTETEQVVESFRHITGEEKSIPSNSVYSLLVDDDGLIWIGYYQMGFSYTLYQSGKFSTYGLDARFDSRGISVRTIAFNGETKLIGSRDGLYFIDESKSIFRNLKDRGLRSSMIICSTFYNGEYYIGTYGGGMYVFNPESLKLRDFTNDKDSPLYSKNIFALRADSSNNLWIGTSDGVFCYNADKLLYRFTSLNSQLPEGNVYEIFFDSTRKGWLCTENGMAVFDPSLQRVRSDVFPGNFINREKIRVVYEDSDRQLYFLPDKGLMFVSDLSMTRFSRLSRDTPLGDKALMSIIEDNDKHLWITTNNGIFRYDKKETFKSYNFSDGLPSSIFINCYPIADSTGRIWFGNSKGLVYCEPDGEDADYAHNYRIAITGIAIDGKDAGNVLIREKDNNYSVNFGSSNKNITVYVSGFTYTDPSNMSYEYKIEGIDSGWRSVAGRSEITYYDLPGGKYTLSVRTTGLPETEIRMAINISYNWLPWIKYILIGILIISLMLSFIYIRRRNPQYLVDMVKRMAYPDKDINPESEISSAITDGQCSTEEKIEKPSDEKYKSNKVSPEECRRLVEDLQRLMEDKKLYTDPELKIGDLAASMNTSAHNLSYLFNQHLNLNYYDYINEYRIGEFKRLIEEDRSDRFTLTAIALQCGFSSRASFFRYFKKATGVTPNEYVKSKESFK